MNFQNFYLFRIVSKPIKFVLSTRGKKNKLIDFTSRFQEKNLEAKIQNNAYIISKAIPPFQ